MGLNQNSEVTKNVTEEPDREQLFIEHLATEPSIRQAGLKAGYSQGYCDSTLCRKLTNPKFQARLREHYKGLKHAQLPLINRIEAQAIDEYLEKPELAIKHPGLLKDLKTAAGIQQEEQKAEDPPARKDGNGLRVGHERQPDAVADHFCDLAVLGGRHVAENAEDAEAGEDLVGTI